MTGFQATPTAKRFFCATCGTHTHLVYARGEGRWAGEVHLSTATLDEADLPLLEERMAAEGRPRYLHVFFSDRAACVGDFSTWASAPKYGGPSGTESSAP